MEDLSIVLKRDLLQKLYKKRSDVFSTVDRAAQMNEKRRTVRHDAAFERRNIPADLTPGVSPAVNREKSPKRPNKRLEMLEKWKANKQKVKKEQLKHAKPLFKVTHVPVEIGLPKLDTINKEIKGKPIKSKFAPINHKFKPPANVKPVTLIATNTKFEERQMITRSQARCAAKSSISSGAKKNKDNESKKPAKEKKGKDKIARPKEQKTTKEDLNESMSPDYPVTNLHENPKTPESNEPPVYISPFVTISRGKHSARKEYQARKEGHSFSQNNDVLDPTSPKAGAVYFEWRLNNQVSRLQELCDQWNKYKVEENPPEEAVSMIDVAIGQTNLLITKKFAQFRNLINICLNGSEGASVTCEDLHGFWDMIYIQVKNLDQRFENLDKLRANAWEEVVPEVKKVPKKGGRPLKTGKPSAALKEAIQAARRRKAGNDTEGENCAEKKTPQRRTSSHVLQVKSAKSSHKSDSPGLMMMKVAQYAKGVDTPGRSILKGSAQKSAKSQPKTVVFEDDVTDSVNDIENDLNNLNLQTKGTTPSKTPTRRSARLSKTKLF